MKERFALALELFMEQRYYSYRSQKEGEGISESDVKAIRKKFRSSLLSNYFIYAFFFLVLSLILFIDNYAKIRTEFYLILIPLYLYILAFSAYTTVSFLEYARKANSVRMLGILPVRRPGLLLFLSWFVYSGSLGIFLLVPASFFFVSMGGSVLELPVQLMNAVTSIVLGYSFGSLISSTRLSSGSVRGRAMRNLSRNMAIAFMFLIFYTGISFLPSADIPSSLFYGNSALLYVPFINFPYSFSFNTYNLLQLWQFLQYSLYIVLSFLVLDWSARRGFRRIMDGGFRNIGQSREDTSAVQGKVGRGYLVPSLIKDSKLIIRESLPSLLIFTPMFLIFPYDVSLFSIKFSGEFIIPFMVVFSAMVSVISAACYSMAFLSAESGGIQYLRILFPDQNRVMRSKMFSSSMIFSIVYIPMALSSLLLSGISPIIWPGIIVSSVSIFCITFLSSFSKLLNRVRNVLRIRGIPSLGTPSVIALDLIPGSAFSLIITIMSVYISLLLSNDASLAVWIWSIISVSAMSAIFLKYGILKSKIEAIGPGPHLKEESPDI
jgi:predicted permease